jgi:FMN phosphatase YigB (HAD superfamily)
MKRLARERFPSCFSGVTFLFDIGRVLLDFDFGTSLARLFPPEVANVADRLNLLLERKDELESGRIDVDTYVSWALEVIGSEVTPEGFCHAWQQIFVPNEPMWTAVRKLAADGHRLILFSNINGIHSPWIFSEFPEFSLFKEAVLSYQTGFIKPQPEIYRHAIGQHGLVAEETRYVDDLTQNIATGREIGFICHQYDLNDHAAFETWLADTLVPPH